MRRVVSGDGSFSFYVYPVHTERTCGFEGGRVDAQPYLQHEAEVRWSFVFGLEVFAVVNVYVVKLDKAHEVTG